jgi:hypothetical protein
MEEKRQPQRQPIWLGSEWLILGGYGTEREEAYIPTHDDEACHGWGTRSFGADGGEQTTATVGQFDGAVLGVV